MTDFSTWSHANLVKLANDSVAEIQHLKADLGSAINAYRTLLKETQHDQNLQQLPTKEEQHDWA